MKITLKQITASVAFAMIFVVLLLISSYIFMPKNNLEEFGMEDATANGILGEKAIPLMCSFSVTARHILRLPPCRYGTITATPFMCALQAGSIFLIPKACSSKRLKSKSPKL